MKHPSTTQRDVSLLVAILLLCALSGCNRDSKTYGKVRGGVTADDKPVAEAVVLFQEPTQHIFIQATTDSDGQYNFDKQPGEGLPIGNYQIAVQPPIQDFRTGDPLPPPKPFPKVDAKLLDPARSGLKLEVKPGDNRLDIRLSEVSVRDHSN